MPSSAKLIPKYVTASVALSFAGLLNGLDTGCIGSVVHMDQFASAIGHLSATVTGITVSVIMLTGIIPALLGGHLADHHGRLRIILPGSVLFGIGAALQATSFSLGQFVAGRAIGGTGQGLFLANVSVYITEVAPMSRRGRLAALPQFMSALGICISYFFCYGTASIPSSLSWRLPYLLQVVTAALLSLACIFLPESPRWLLQHGRAQEAVHALEKLDFNMIEARRDFLVESQQRPSLSGWQSFRLLFGPAYRQRTLLALFVLSMAQLSGIDAITYYAPALFRQAGISGSSSSLVASGVASITMLVVSIPGFLLADKWGRRTSAISGGIALGGLMILIGSLYAAKAVTPTSAARWVVVASVFLFGMVFCATWAIFAKIYASEIQPGNTRAAGNSVGMAFSFFTNWLVAMITPILLAASAYGAYFLFGGLVLASVIVFSVYMPETRGRSLESIQDEFRHTVNLSQFSRLLRPLGIRRRTVPSQYSEGVVELHEQAYNESAASAVSVNVGGRGLRVEVGAS